jgi:hypothetical protein
LPGKCDEFDLLIDKDEEYDNRIAIGICATGVYKPYSDWSDILSGGSGKLPYLYFKNFILFRFQILLSVILYEHQIMQF